MYKQRNIALTSHFSDIKNKTNSTFSKVYAVTERHARVCGLRMCDIITERHNVLQ